LLLLSYLPADLGNNFQVLLPFCCSSSAFQPI